MNLTEILYHAISTPSGCVVETTDPALLKRKLNALRKKLSARGEDLSSLRFRSSPTNPANEIWITKENQNAEET